MKTIARLLVIASLFLCGCSTISNIKIPPGSLTAWHHIGNYGPYSDNVTVTNVTKLSDGTFVLGEYDGQISWLGFGPHDIISGLHIDGTGQIIK